MPRKTDRCLLCNISIHERYWLYIWRDKQGGCCEKCGQAIHTAGYKIIDAISGILKDHGVGDIYSKEKFGYYRLSVAVTEVHQKVLAETLFQMAREDFPEFSFDFSAYEVGQLL